MSCHFTQNLFEVDHLDKTSHSYNDRCLNRHMCAIPEVLNEQPPSMGVTDTDSRGGGQLQYTNAQKCGLGIRKWSHSE